MLATAAAEPVPCLLPLLMPPSLAALPPGWLKECTCRELLPGRFSYVLLGCVGAGAESLTNAASRVVLPTFLSMARRTEVFRPANEKSALAYLRMGTLKLGQAGGSSRGEALHSRA